jgi:hypothetical protein
MQMTENELSEVISKFQMPEGRYLIEQEGSFGRGEFFWIIKNQSTNQKYLLMNTYSHHGVEAELECYREGGFENLEAIPRRIETLEIPSDAEDEISKYLFGFYSIFEIKS